MNRKQKLFIAVIIIIPVLIGSTLHIGIKTGKSRSFENFYKKIGLVRITDVIYSSEHYTEQLQKFRKNDLISGVVLRINSPGGAVAPSQEIFNEVKKFKDSNKPVFVSMGNVAASGGYYISSAATKIFANPGTITGSIGVIFQFPQYYKLMDKIGVNIETIKAGKFKDAGNPNRPMSEAERKYLQKLLDNTHHQFISDVSSARNIHYDTLSKISDGRIFTGSEAAELNLVDSLGGYSETLSALKNYLGLPENTKVVEKSSTSSFLNNFFNSTIGRVTSFIDDFQKPSGCYYLFQS